MCFKLDWRHICQEWRIWIRPLLIISYIMFAIIVVPLLIVNSVRDGFSRKDQLILIGGLFVLSSIPISIWHIMQHVIHYTQAVLQKHIIRILWMIPIYALNAWLGLLFPNHSIYFDSFRECYEAYVIYNFMVYLLNYLNLGMDLEQSLEHKPQVKHFFPLCFMKPWRMGREFIHNCKHGIIQYTALRITTTFIAFVCELSGVYGEGIFAFSVAFPYIIIVNNLTQFVAMYCLVLFYRANKDDLKPMRPIPKLLCIKAVVFFSFFQGVVINFLVYFGYIKNVFGSTEVNGDYKGLASLLQNFLICIEMFIAAIAHIYSFPHKPFHINEPQYWNNPNRNWFNSFVAMWDITDVQEDVAEHLGVVGSTLSRPFRGRSNYNQVPHGGYSTESQYLIPHTSTSSTSDLYQTAGNEKSFSNTNYYSKNRYGAIDNLTTTTKQSTTQQSNFGGININKKNDDKKYSPHYGAPTSTGSSYFLGRTNNKQSNQDHTIKNIIDENSGDGGGGCADESSSSNRNDTSSKSDSLYIGNVRKSNSNSSDWLSTPTDEILGIDVKGIEKDRLTYLGGDPKA